MNITRTAPTYNPEPRIREYMGELKDLTAKVKGCSLKTEDKAECIRRMQAELNETLKQLTA